MRTNGSTNESAGIIEMTLLDQSMAEIGLRYGPCWVTLLDEDENELPVVRKVARMVERTSSQITWSAVSFLSPVRYALGADRRRRRTVFAAASGTPCGKAVRLGSIEVRPDELVTVAPRVSANPRELAEHYPTEE